MEESDVEASETDPLVTKDSLISGLDQRHPKEGVKGKKRTENKVSFDIKKNEDLTSDKNNEKERQLPTITKRSIPEPPQTSYLHTLSECNEGPCMEEVYLPLRNKPDGTTDQSSTVLCPFFGVKNYLNYFYERPDLKQQLYLMEGNEEAFLVKRSETACTSKVFRLSLFLGGIILLLGTIAFTVAMCASRRLVLEGKVGGITVVDKVAAAHNAEMDALLLVSLLAVTVGATIIAAALISKTFCSQQVYDEAFSIDISSMYNHPAVIHNVDKRIPVTEQLTSIQPWARPIYLTSKYPPCSQ